MGVQGTAAHGRNLVAPFKIRRWDSTSWDRFARHVHAWRARHQVPDVRRLHLERGKPATSGEGTVLQGRARYILRKKCANSHVGVWNHSRCSASPVDTIIAMASLRKRDTTIFLYSSQLTSQYDTRYAVFSLYHCLAKAFARCRRS